MSSLLAISLASPALAATPNDFDLGKEVSAYRRFIIYPHLEKGLSAMRHGNHERAIASFLHARKLAPTNARTALYLADAYNHSGNPEQARSTLEDQLRHTPDDPHLLAALNQLKKPTEPQKAAPETAAAIRTKPENLPDILPESAIYEANFLLELHAGRFPVALRHARALLREENGSASLLDSLSFQLMQAGGKTEAMRLLLDAYPFSGATPADRERLFDRLAQLAIAYPERIAPAERARLKRPLATPALRARQAAVFAALKDCPAVRAILGDLSPDYRANEWILMGNCYRDQFPGLAQHAYAQAQRFHHDGYATRMLAYQAFATHDYGTALAAWRSLPANALTPDELRAGITTALAAGDTSLAKTWLDLYLAHGGKQDDLYWWQRAQTDIAQAPATAQMALERAIALRQTAQYYGQLASLQHAAGKEKEALASLEKAGLLAPDDNELKLALGYAYWRNDAPEKSRAILEKVYATRPDDDALVQQLVYVNQRLGDNQAARARARQVIDNLDRYEDDERTDAIADLRYGFRRLHEDLGRRWTFSLDATSGTHAASSARSPNPGSSYRGYSQMEAEYRLGDPAINDGRTFSAYARVFAGSGENNKALPIHEPTLGAGLRWKPWRDQVIFFAIEKQVPLDRTAGSKNDTMLRASASLFNAGRFSDDWHAAGDGWMAQNLYLDAAHYLTSKLSSFTSDYRLSYHNKIASAQTIEPYGHLQYNLIRSRTEQAAANGTDVSYGSSHDMRVGIGLRWNLWQGGNRYDAYPGRISMGLEFQRALSTYLDSKNAIFLTFGGRW